MPKNINKQFQNSIRLLDNIAKTTMIPESRNYMLASWKLNLVENNPSWKFINFQIHCIEKDNQQAHVISMIDKRLPDLGLVGYFGATNINIGAEVLELAIDALKDKGISKIYGPIDGIIINNYRLSLQEDVLINGEPVNPYFYIDCFTKAGFNIYNNYLTGKASIKNIKLLNKVTKLPNENRTVKIREFDKNKFIDELNILHNLTNEIFPSQSVYCTEYTLEEFSFIYSTKTELFSSRYLLFLELDGDTIGAVYAYPVKDSLVIKTIGIKKQFQGSGLSKYLIKEIHKRGIDDGYQSIIYALVRKDNSISKNRQPWVKIIRKYQTMVMEIK